MSAYQKAYASLNANQRRAVDQTDGPVLVIAGPGTGKTQLLSTRIAHILATTDTLPENILCLTFTEAAAANMRERLTNMIGSAAYSVTISTYHAFGNDLLKRYPEFFAEAADLQPADALRIDQIMRTVQDGLPYSNGLKHEIFLPDVKGLISDYKRALLSPADVRTVADANQEFLEAATKLVREHIGVINRLSKSHISNFSALLQAGDSLPSHQDLPAQPLADLWRESLADAVASAEETGKTTSLTTWKNRWLAKDGEGAFIAGGQAAVRRQRDAAQIYERYLHELTKQNLYDYDDMILQAIHGLQTNDDLRFTMQERYQYLLLDEFQDTNEAQLRLVHLLTDNPVNEGRPNVLAVGDDDQAIYAFQGANYSHMLEFYHHYQDVLVVPLTQNYRSQEQILRLAEGISGQIAERLHHNFPAISKELQAATTNKTPAVIERLEFQSDLSQNAWTAQKIAELIKPNERGEQTLQAKDIAVLAPKHQYLESLVPFLRQQGIPVHYEKREDVLADPAIEQLIVMSRLVVALANQDIEAANTLWPQVLSLPFWDIRTSVIWETSWQARSEGWTTTLLNAVDLRLIALFFIRLSMQALQEPLELTLDYLSGVTNLPLNEPEAESYRSPFYSYYFGDTTPAPDESVPFWQLLSNLTVLRQRLRDYRSEEARTPTIADFLQFVAAHQAANIKILNTNPYQEADNAVELITAYKSKGMEFEAVFVLALNDEVWGSRARTQAGRIAIPENLKYIRYAGATEDERLRLLFVALTRAKAQLYLTNFTTSFSGSTLSRLKYLQETTADNGAVISALLPAGSQTVIHGDTVPPTIEDLSVYWHSRHATDASSPQLKSLLASRLKNFQLSATQLNRFTDTTIDGPTSFLLRDLLKFPTGSSIEGTYGNIIHECLRWLQTYLKNNNQLPTEKLLLDKLTKTVENTRLSAHQAEQLLEKGKVCLVAYLKQRAATMQPTDRSEYDFHDEGVFVGKAHLTGKIDRFAIDEDNKTITIVDYKTGRPHSRWTNDAKLLRYRQQLYFYKLLIEQSTTWRGYKVTDAYLEFVQPDEDGAIHELRLTFDPDEYEAFKLLVQALWQYIMALYFPNVADYSADYKGILAFQTDLTSTDPPEPASSLE